jgi:hypothetical protein
VKPRLSTLPELVITWQEAISAPVVGARYLPIRVLPAHIHKQSLQLLFGYHLTLRGDRRCEARFRGPRREVLVGGDRVDLLDGSFDSDLAVKRKPQEQRAGTGLEFEIIGLAAQVISEEHETGRVKAI